MAGQKRDAKWLKQQLSRVLGWDEMIVEGLVDTVVRAAGPGGDRAELDEMVQNFMADSPAGIALINDFLSAQASPAPPPPRGPPSSGPSAAAARAASSTAAAVMASVGPSSRPGGSNAATAAAGGAAGGGGSVSGGGVKSYATSASRPQGTATVAPGAGATSASAGGGGGSGSGTAAAAGGASRAAAPSRGDDGAGDDFGRFVVNDRGPGGGGGGGARSRHGSNRDLQALDASAANTEKPSPADSGKVLGMFKAGGRIKTPAAKPVSVRGPEGGALAIAASLERKVLNCLGCGKIYDCRSVTNDVIRFLERGGVCTFCGDTVPLSYKDRQKALEAAAAAGMTADAAAAAAADGGGTAARDQQPSSFGAAAAGAGAVEDAAVAAAKAFKDRLVEYDRNAAKRTTVIDDQSDFFEIDTNAWLTDQEREELRQRQQLEVEAEAARRKKLTVTIDLIGRKVVLDEDVRKAEEAEAMAAAERTAAARKAAAAAEALRNTDGDGTGGGSAYGSGVAFSGNAMGGMAASGPTQEQLAAALDSLRRMKATINPAVAASTSAPLFLPTTTGNKSNGNAGSSGKTAAGSSGGAGSRRYGPAGSKGGDGTTRPAGRHERVQHDLGAEFGFDAFGAEVALDELMGGTLLGGNNDEEDGPYDICPPDMAPSTSYSSAAATARGSNNNSSVPRTPKPVPGLPPGLVLIKGFLSVEEQIRLVRQIRELGIGPGGFYIPSYGNGARLALRMMCLGLHWEPRTSKYEKTRSAHDGATPPTIPAWMVELCGRCLAAASTASTSAPGGTRLPPLQPDICLANFYERSGRLGMHQDKDELPDSLRAGLPVVSLSLGDAADFMYGRSRDVEEAQSARLESGDLLVFGGPSRMIFHSVSKIYPHTAPPELIKATGVRPGRLNLTFRQYRAAGGDAGGGQQQSSS